MPRRKNYRTNRRRPRRTIRRRKGKMNRPNKTVAKTVAIPDRAYVKLKFADQYTISTSGNRHQYSGSNPGDPTFTASYANPANMWATYASLYEQYICKAAKFTVRVVANNTVPASLIYGCNNGSISSVDDVKLLRQPYQRQKLIGFATGQGVVRGSMYMSARKMAGYNYLDISDWAGTTNPSSYVAPYKQWSIGIQLNPLDNTTALSHYVFVDITYYVEFFSRKYVDDQPVPEEP